MLRVALRLVRHWTDADIIANYGLREAEIVKLGAGLDRLGIIDLLPENRINAR